MAMRRADAVALPGGTGDHLMADQASLRELGPPVRVPWLYGIRRQLVPVSKFDYSSHCPRAVRVCAVGGQRASIAHCTVAHPDSETWRQPRESKFAQTSVNQSFKFSLPSNARFDRCLRRPRQSKPMNFGEAGIHRMFQLNILSPREDSGTHNRFSMQGRAVRLCHMAKETPARGETFGLRWCPPVPPAPSGAFQSANAKHLRLMKHSAMSD
jgi:hypothetical protein